MEKDKQVTGVTFYLERDCEGNEVFAYFPNEMYDTTGILRSCYAHIGQHSGCHPEYLKGCKKATPEQYNDLKTELESIGYNLEIIK